MIIGVNLKWEHHCQIYPPIFLHLVSDSHHSCLNQSFACRLIFFPLIPDPTCWQHFLRLTDKEELLLWTCFSTALSGEALSPIRFWANPLSHSCLLTSFIYKALNSEMKASENPIWKWHKNRPGSAPTNMSRHGITLSSRSIYLCKYWMPQKSQSLSFADHHTLPGEFCLLLALSLYPFPSFFFLSSTKQSLPACSHGILSTLLRRNKTPSEFLWYRI